MILVPVDRAKNTKNVMEPNMKDLEVIVPATLDGWSILHEFYQVDWPRWNQLDLKSQKELVQDYVDYLDSNGVYDENAGQSAIFQILGHKGDFLHLHFRKDFHALGVVENEFKKTKISSYMISTSSYVSILELGMYDYTMKLEKELRSKEIEFESEQWKKEWSEAMESQKQRVFGRLFSEIPDRPYLCFYPMNKRRGEVANWYQVEMAKRGAMMLDHGKIGRKYAGKVNQIISGSIGFDDWEWGVDLFADSPNVFKDLIYEMRFDEASALYAEFGPFFIGLRLKTESLEKNLLSAI